MDAPYLLSRKEAAQRYGISLRTLNKLYKQFRDFPVIRQGRKVLIHRERADAWFTEWIGGKI